MLRFLWWIVLSALYCLSAWWMYVPWTVKITYLFFIMFHLCLIGFYSRFIIFHWFVQCALHVLIMFIHVFNCCVLIIFHLFVLVLICFSVFLLTSVRFWTECRIMFIDFSIVFLLRWKWGIQYANMVPAIIVNMDDGGRKCLFHNSVYVNDCGANSQNRRCPPDHHRF